MKKKKIKNPLIRRIPRELTGDWKKYLVVSLFLILMIGFVSGMYVANESMMTAADEGVGRYKREDGHFELKKKADETLLDAIKTGDKADVRQYYIDEAKKKLDKKFDSEFEEKFKKEFDEKFETEFREKFDAEFQSEFDVSFNAQIKQMLMAQGLDETTAGVMLDTAVAQAKQSGQYNKAYDTAYEKAYPKAHDEAYEKAFDEAHDEAYEKAYDEAWNKVLDEINEKYADAEEKYELNDPDFKETPVHLYENFYRDEEEDHDNDGTSDGTVRVFAKTDDINFACLMDGSFPEKEDEIAIDRMHADNVGIKVGDEITVGEEKYQVVGLIAYVNYSTLHEKSTDLMFDALKFNVAMVTDEGFAKLHKTIHYDYAWKYENEPSDEKDEKNQSDDFMRALLTQTVVNDNEIEDYVPKYANPAIHFATDDMGSDEAMGGVLLDILIVIIAFIFAVTISNTITKESSAIGTLRASGYTKGELVRHYLSMPVIVTLISALVGNVLGYTVFKDVVVSMYYNSYSLPTYETIWNPDAFFKTTLIPVVLMFMVNLIVIIKMMQHTPLQFLRHDLKKTKRKKAMRLPHFKFFKRFRLCSLQKKSDVIDEEVSVYGISDDSKYVEIKGMQSLQEDEVYISRSFSEKYELNVGDTVSLDEKYENKQYTFTVAGIYDQCVNIAVFMPIENYRMVFELDEEAFSGYFSNEELTDLSEDDIATVITERDITKMCDQLDHSMGSYMDYFQILCILLSAVLIYLLTKLIIEKNENAISMTKILGYENKEIASLYLLSTTIMVVIEDAVSVVLGAFVMNLAWKAILFSYSGWFAFVIQPAGYVKMFAFVLIGYLFVMILDFMRIKKIPMDQALKNVE